MRKETRCRHIGYSFRLTDRIAHTTAFVTPVVDHWLEREIAQWVDTHTHTPPWRIVPTTHRTMSERSYHGATSRSSIVDLLALPSSSWTERTIERKRTYQHSSFEAGRSSEVERSLMVRWVVESILHGVDPLSYFSFQPLFHDWCNKGRGMCYSVCGMVHIKEPLLLIDKSSLCDGSGFPIRMVWRHITVDKMCWVRG